ncbi:MAG: hypothetical protein Kow0026_15890 [Oricola sp.]
MKRLVSAAAVAAFSALAVAGTAQASVISNSELDAIRSLQSGQYMVTPIDSLDHSQAAVVREHAAVDAAAVQRAIRANPALLRDLKAQHLEVDNIVAAAPAMDGTMTLYLR